MAKPKLKDLKKQIEAFKKTNQNLLQGTKAKVANNIKAGYQQYKQFRELYQGYHEPKTISNLYKAYLTNVNKLMHVLHNDKEEQEMYQYASAYVKKCRNLSKITVHKNTTKATNDVEPIKFVPRESTKVMAQGLDKILSKHQVALLYSGTGTGKTFATIDAIGRKVPKCHIIVVTKVRQVRSHQWKRSVLGYNKTCGTHMDILEINYEKFRMKRYFKKIAARIEKYNRKHEYVIVVFDEVHNLKSPTSKTTKYALKLLKYQLRYDYNEGDFELKNYGVPYADKVIGLSATPFSNSIIDAISYLIMDGKYSSKTEFYRVHKIDTDQFHQPIVKDRHGKVRPDWVYNYDQIVDQMRAITERVNNNDIKPTVKVATKKFHYNRDLTHKYREIYKDYRKGVYDSIQKTIMAEIKFLAEHSKQRFDYMRELINDKHRPQTPIIIFYQYVYEFDALINFCHKYYPSWNIIRLDGRTNKKQQQKTLTKNTPKNTFILAQYQAGGTSIDLRYARLTIYYAPTVSYEDYKQSQGRNVRAFTHHTVYHIRLWQKNTINGKIWDSIIDNKAKFTSDLAAELIQ